MGEPGLTALKLGSASRGRPLRIEYPGAVDHITARGNAGNNIYHKVSLVINRRHYRVDHKNN